jgi:sialate O-acetylesterase
MKKILSLITAGLIISLSANAQIKLPRLIRDSMILQRDCNIRLWGWASKGESIKIRFNGKTYHTKTGDDGAWMVRISPLSAGGPYTMEITGSNKIVLHDILIGDLWVCSGQSNMVHQLQLHSILYRDEIATANYPAIRQFWIPTTSDIQSPRTDLPPSYWKPATSGSVQDFSAVAYFFAKDLFEKMHIPIGLINASVGGTPIEAWISEDGFKAFPAILKTIEKNKDTAYTNSFARKSPGTGTTTPRDKGLTGPLPWYDTAYIPKGWKQIGIPGYWEDQGIKDLNGTVWYRRTIDVPPSMINHPAKVFLGRIVDADILYIK